MKILVRNTKLITAGFIALLIVSMSSCRKNELQPEQDIFRADYRNLQLNTGFSDNSISINAERWSVAYVKDAVSGELLMDKTGKSMVLNDFGTIELSDHWLKLEKKKESNMLSISLRENFSSNPRRFLIGIVADGRHDELSFTQVRGNGYKIVEKQITEVAESRKQYSSIGGTNAITLSNSSSTARYMETSGLFKNVNYISEFTSGDYGAFDWLDPTDLLISMDEVLKDGVVYWSGKVPYRSGESLIPFVKKEGNGDKVLVQPFTNVRVSGEVVYLERKCRYTFSIKNLSSGNTFEISGIWKQKIPISTTISIY